MAIPYPFIWNSSGSSGGGGNSFTTIQPSSGTSPVADSATDTLTINGTSPITVTGDSTTDTITIAMPVVTGSVAGYVSTALYNSWTAKLSSSLTANRIFVGNAGNSAVNSGGFSSGSDMTNINHNGVTTKFTVSSLGGGVYAPLYAGSGAGVTNSIVVRDSGGLGWINVGGGIQGNYAQLPQLYNFASIYNCSDNLMIDLENSAYYSSNTGLTVLDLDGYKVYDMSGNLAYDIGNRYYYASDGSEVADFENRNLLDSGNNYALSWATGNLDVYNKISYYNFEATQGNGIPAILGYIEDISVTSSSLVPYTAVVDCLVRVTVMIEINSVGTGTFDVLMDYTTATSNYTTFLMRDCTADRAGILVNTVDDLTTPKFKNGAQTAIIPLKSGNSITVYTNNFSGSQPSFDMKVTVERLN